MKKFILFIILSSQMLIVPFVESMDQKKLYEFLTEYNSSDEKKSWGWNRLAYAIEKGHVDIASFLVSRGEIMIEYRENHPSDQSKINHSDRKLTDCYFKHPLITAIRKGYNDLAIEMIQTGLQNKDFSEVRLAKKG